MAQVRWNKPISGDFDTAADWKGGVAPGASDGVILGVAGTAYTVTSDDTETVRSIQLTANATLAITSGTFTA
jgi:hypothetical protein